MPFVELSPDTKLDPVPSGGGSFKRFPPETTLDAPPSFGERFLHGVAQPFYGAAQIGARMQEPGATVQADPTLSERVDKAVSEREQSYQERRKAGGQTGMDVPELAGEVTGQALNPFNYLIPAAGAETALGRVALSALAGAGSSLFDPVSSGDSFWISKAKQAVGGTAVGGAVGAVAQPVASAVAPALQGAAGLLSKAGVQLTPGQMSGGLGRFLEDRVLRNFPILGYFVHGAQSRSVEDFNRAVGHQVLEPIGKTIPKNIEAGTGLADYVSKEISDEYGHILPLMSFKPDADFQARLGAVAQQAMTLTPAAREQFRGTVSSLFSPHFGKPDISGEELNKIMSELGTMGARYRKSALASEQDLGRVFVAARGAIEDSLERQNPASLVTALQNTRASFAMLVRMDEAAARRPKSEGIFSPADLLAATKKLDPSARKRDFAHGDALLQPFATAGQQVLPSKVADSGTTEAMSHMAAAAGIGGGSHMFFGSMMPAEAIAGGTVASPIYTRPGISALNWLFARDSGQAAKTSRKAIETGYPFAGGVVGGPAANAMGIAQ